MAPTRRRRISRRRIRSILLPLLLLLLSFVFCSLLTLCVTTASAAVDASTSETQTCAEGEGGEGEGSCASSANEEDNQEDQDPSCTDMHDKCGFWALRGECDKNPKYMSKNCQRSCDLCGDSGHDSGDDEEEEEDSEDREDSSDDDDDDDDEYDYDVPCEDRYPLCGKWAHTGECEANEKWMAKNCPASCETCGGPADLGKKCADRIDDCAERVDGGGCLLQRNFMNQNCQRSCYLCVDEEDMDDEERIRAERYLDMYVGPTQVIGGSEEEKKKAKENVIQTSRYLRETMLSDDVTDLQRDTCLNNAKHCAFWAGLGRCEDKKDFMLEKCRLACRACTSPTE